MSFFKDIEIVEKQIELNIKFQSEAAAPENI